VPTLTIEKLDEVYIRVYSESNVEFELKDYFTYDYPGAKFTPQYRARLWDGKVYLYDVLRKTLYSGLLPYVYKFAESNGYEVVCKNIPQHEDTIAVDDITAYADTLAITSRGQALSVRDYQVDAVHKALNHKRAVLVSPTGSGKSLIIYIVSRWLLDQGKKVLVVVPTTSLVEQMYGDFSDYSATSSWHVDDHCQKLYSGFPKRVDHDVLFTTWQSIVRQPRQWFDQFDAVIGDEAHLFKAKSLTTIMEKMPGVAYRIGTTGSLDDKKLNRLVLQGIFGAIHKVTTTKKLQDIGQLAQLKITALLLKHDPEMRKSVHKVSYADEIDAIVRNPKRNKFIRNLALQCTGNTLILFQYVEKHGMLLEQLIAEKAGNRKVFFVYGGTEASDREKVRQVLSRETDAIVIASNGVFSTGINIPSIENIIFASPSKSRIRNLQSIGRGLRLSEGKQYCMLYDLTDDLSFKSWKNHTLKHGAVRYKLYVEEQFPIKLVEVAL